MKDERPEGTPAPRRRRLPSDERRREFVTRAVEFFAEEGFESSTRGLAKRLGVTQPLLYRYFPSKEDLIHEVYETVYVNRWRPEWAGLIGDRSRPLADRLNEFYNAYTEVIFNREWMRIYLFSGLKGVDINRRYMQLVRQRILEPIVMEARAEAGLPEAVPRDDEVEFAWVMHGGIFYYGVRDLIYESCVSADKQQVIADAVAAFLHGLALKRG
ncbi:MAG: TetR/AcrR family transcriptional regulator [Rhodobacteraceae bacterium]|nr:TetR/AcrR family transcriptional regulator [Paracoccaceae bacterium]MCZ8153367.1 TetR/AcrR family transcriptional regulator [Paracoccaceae bacterium]MCZ8333050.1 TetR/AcrR family transcriptional regulator [Paracoccaceae bacterium]